MGIECDCKNDCNHSINGMKFVTRPCDEYDNYESFSPCAYDHESNPGLIILLSVIVNLAFIVAVFVFIARNI